MATLFSGVWCLGSQINFGQQCLPTYASQRAVVREDTGPPMFFADNLNAGPWDDCTALIFNGPEYFTSASSRFSDNSHSQD